VELVGLRGALVAFAMGNAAIAAVVALAPAVRRLARPADG
jgi:hypothetical protein